ncbi:SREC-like protein, partial [Mya arenaria]
MGVCRQKDMIFCNVSMQCIGRNLVCDGVKDCGYGEDETLTACALKQQCESNWSLSEGCIVRCKPGYFGKFCQSCVDKCLNGICDKQTGICLNCTPGYFGEYCEQNCSKECVNGICNSKSGICKDCTPGYFGEYCEQNCSKECVNGICNSKSGICKNCIPGYFGKYCEETCSNECLNGLCNSSSGICKHCIRTYYENCSLECGQECREREGFPQCDRQSGNCLHGCNFYYFGHKCNKICKNCKGNSSNDPCGINGVCYFGCKNDYWDKNCTTKCNANCQGDEQGNRCNSSTGECLYGCTRGWSGRSCEDVSSVQSTTSESTEKENVNSLKTTLIVISASFIVVLVVAGIICYFWGQKRLKRQLNERKELRRNIQDDVQPGQEPSGSPTRESSSLYADINEESMELYHYICEQNVPDHYEEISVTKYDGNTEIVHLEEFTVTSNSRRSITQSEGKNELDSTDETKSRQSVTQSEGGLDQVENTNGIDGRRRFVNSSRSNESVCTNENFDLDTWSQTTKAENRRMLAAKYCEEEEDIFGDLGQFQVDYIHAIEREESELPYDE